MSSPGGARTRPRLYFEGRWRYQPANISIGEEGLGGLNLAAAAWCAARNSGWRVRVASGAVEETGRRGRMTEQKARELENRVAALEETVGRLEAYMMHLLAESLFDGAESEEDTEHGSS